VFEGQSMTYFDLNARANQLARHLVVRGVRPGDLVAICFNRGIEMVIGLLGVLKAGGAYVPLDPNYPPERLQYMLEDSAPRVVLTQSALMAQLRSSAARVIAVDAEWAEVARQSTDDLAAATAAGLAYVIYTSGSTGKPKGVMVEHGHVTRLFTSTAPWFEFGERDVWTLFHSIAFDFSVWELWGALLHGGRVVIVPHLTARSPQDFYRLVCSEGVTVLNQTPSAFAQLSEAQAALPLENHSLRFVIFGGEALEPHTLRSWVARNGMAQPQLINMYGITETTVHVTYKALTEEDMGGGRASLVGRPIPDLRVYLLDPQRRPAPIGVPGEIYVGGAGVARGYLNRPALTAERFIDDPFASVAGERLYKSGDLASWRADGTLEYLGRNDQQVKIRGFRIELGEVEACIARHPSVQDVAVIARGQTAEEKQLVAYVTPRNAQIPPQPESLRTELNATLPHYMVPSAFVVLAALPLTANGKLDRRALPEPQLDAYSTLRYQAPEGAIETIVAGIWSELLHIDRVGREDNFFALGGHSLLAMQLIARVQDALATDMPIGLLFEQPTLRGMSAQLAQLQGSKVPSADGDDIDMEDVMQSVALMPDHEVQELLRELTMEERL